MNRTQFGSAVKTESKGETRSKEVKAPYFRVSCLYYNRKNGACKMKSRKCVSVDLEGNCGL